ncbi:phage tail domain-containing protein [Lacticaseibacillus paracasei]|uniref:phage tail domain-containing protein n=1 Tax=Lacticaseibacillus paracasei TaxID=1597 RepID=UPI002360C94B|nr:phage tail domain-containing protein [Lacticaseibacillus paracasei]
MDLLVEKLDGSRYYLSQYKVLITDFEESAPSVTRNSMKLDQRNGNIDFGGWHTDKTINITGYYRADDIDEEETLREKLYALLSDPNGYYITQLKTSPKTAVERPGETSGNYYDRLRDYPSHKRFLVYTEAPEMDLVGNVNGTLLYKLTSEFKTLKLPYGETPAIDIAIDNTPYKDVPVNLLTGTTDRPQTATGTDYLISTVGTFVPIKGHKYTARVRIVQKDNPVMLQEWTMSGNKRVSLIATTIAEEFASNTFTVPDADNYDSIAIQLAWTNGTDKGSYTWSEAKVENGTTASPWSPNPADPEYYTQGISIPYLGTVPCNQLDQGFTVQLTATGSASSLSFKINDTELTSSNAVAAGDVILLNGFSYTQNGLSIVSKTNKAYFILQPDKPNKITCNVPGPVKILGFQNLYA